MEKPGSLFLFMGIILIATALTGFFWYSKKQLGPESHTGISEEVRIGIALQPGSSLAIIAHEEKLFSKEGLDATVIEYPSGKRAMKALAEGEVSVATTADIPVVFAAFEQQNFSILAEIASTDHIVSVVARVDKGIRSPGDLKGKRIAVQKASAVHYFLHLFLLRNGIPEHDVEIIYKDIEELPDAIVHGEADAISVREPYVSRTRALIGDNAVVFSEKGIYDMTELVTASHSFIRQSPAAVKKILKALRKAENLASAQPDEALGIIVRRLGIDKSEAAVLLSFLDLRVALRQALLINLENEGSWVVRSGLTENKRMPNYLDLIHLDGMQAVKPEVVSVIR